jgi:hypothetical protein
MFQPNPTTVTVVPPARSIQVVGQPEALVADEELGVETVQGTPQALPLAQGQGQGQGQSQSQAPLAQAPSQQGGYMAPMMQMPMMQMQMPQMQMPQMQMPQMQMPQMQMGSSMPQQYNMSPYPAVYAASQPQPAQLFSSGVPGAPPTIAVDTGAMQMGGFLMPSMTAAPKAIRNTTQKRTTFGNATSEKASDPNMRITVIKGGN